MTVLTAAGILGEARRLVEERGWGPLQPPGLSIYRAVVMAALGHAFDGSRPFEDEAVWRAAIDGPCRYLEHLVTTWGFAGVAHWEMTDGRSQADVVHLFELAEAAAQRALRTTTAVAA